MLLWPHCDANKTFVSSEYSFCPPAPDQEGAGPGSVCPGAVTMMDAELSLQSPAQLQSEVTQFPETGITVNEGGVVS